MFERLTTEAQIDAFWCDGELEGHGLVRLCHGTCWTNATAINRVIGANHNMIISYNLAKGDKGTIGRQKPVQ